MFMYNNDTDSSGYDIGQLYAFEHDKLGQVQRLLTESGARVQGIMQKYSDPAYKEIVAELGQEFTSFRAAVTNVLIAAMPQYQRDPFQELQALQNEKQQGYEKLSALNDELQRLRDKAGAQNRLIEELQGQLRGDKPVDNDNENNDNNNNNNSTNLANGVSNDGNDDPPYSTPLNFDDPTNVSQENTIVQLTNELETAQMNVGELRKVVDELTNQNKRFSVEILQLRDQVNQSYVPNLNANNIFDNGSHINANATNPSELQRLNSIIEQLRVENSSLKEDNRLQQGKLEDLKRKIEASGGQSKHLFRTDTVTNWNPNDLDQLKAEMNKQKLALMTERVMNTNNIEESMQSINENYNMEKKQSRLFRNDTRTDWEQSELDKLKDELMEHLQHENRKAIQQQIDKQMRYPDDGRRSTNLVGAGAAGVMTEEDMEKLAEQMKEEITQQNRKIIMDKTQKAFDLRKSVNTGINANEFEEAQQRLLEMQQADTKDKLRKQFAKWDQAIAPVAEPTADQYDMLNQFLKTQLGLLNENIRNRTINELKSVFTEQRDKNLNAGTRDSEPQSVAQTPLITTNQNISGSLLDDVNDDAEVLANTYPTPGGPTPGGPDDDEITPGGPTPGGPTPGGPVNTSEYDELIEMGAVEPPASQTEWAKISENQTKEIEKLTKELFSRNDEINALRMKNGELESTINQLRQDIENGNIGGGNKNKNNNNNNSNEMESMQKQINDLKTMKLQLIRSTAKEMDHLRNMIRAMQRRLNGES